MAVLKNDNKESGLILNISKPIGWTSFDVVRRIKRIAGSVKVGHAGTLDPFADGVLLVCIAKATKRIAGLMACEKEYIATLQLGMETDSLDITGRVIKKAHVPVLDLAKITAVAKTFEGEIDQVPPLFSAVKINGKRSYQHARAGNEITNKVRQVRIHEIQVVDYQDAVIQFRVVCSKGTYIRSLARDMALKLNSVGYLRKLTRTRIGEYKIQSSLQVNELKSVETEFNGNNFRH